MDSYSSPTGALVSVAANFIILKTVQPGNTLVGRPSSYHASATACNGIPPKTDVKIKEVFAVVSAPLTSNS